MFDRILVPTDGSARAEEAIAVARQMAQHDGSRLVLLRIESERAPVADVVAANDAIEARVGELRSQGIKAEARFEYGQPEQGIATSAARESADLIIMAPRHRNLVQSVLHPSVTKRIFAHAARPVLVWPEALPAGAFADLLRSPHAAVILPLDGSEEAERAMPLAVGLAQKYSTCLLVMRAIVPAPLASTGDGYMLELDSQAREEHAAREYLSALRKRLARDADITVQTMLVAGDAAEEIARVAEAHEHSLIVMSTHGRGGIARALLGSVASKLVERAPVPIIVVPPIPAVAVAAAQEEALAPMESTPEEPLAPAF